MTSGYRFTHIVRNLKSLGGRPYSLLQSRLVILSTYTWIATNHAAATDTSLFLSKASGVVCANLQLRDLTYRVKTSDCYKVPATCPDASRVSSFDDASDDDDMMAPTLPQVVFPQIPPPPATPPEIASVPTPMGQHPYSTALSCELQETPESTQADPDVAPPSPRRSARQRRRPSSLCDYVMDS